MEYELSEDQYTLLLQEWGVDSSSLEIISFSQLLATPEANLLLLKITNPERSSPLRITCHDISYFQFRGNLREKMGAEIAISQNCSGWVVEYLGRNASIDLFIQAGRITVNQKPKEG